MIQGNIHPMALHLADDLWLHGSSAPTYSSLQLSPFPSTLQMKHCRVLLHHPDTFHQFTAMSAIATQI